MFKKLIKSALSALLKALSYVTVGPEPRGIVTVRKAAPDAPHLLDWRVTDADREAIALAEAKRQRRQLRNMVKIAQAH